MVSFSKFLARVVLPSSLLSHVSGSPTQYLNFEDSGMTTIESKVAPGGSLSYKQTSNCETTPGVKAFSGYVRLPSALIGSFGGASSYNASIFFWYFQARNAPQTSPLAIYLGGGPGSTSLLGVYSENGPCIVNPDSNSTTHNPWSWNNHVNMLYIDQPVQTGFSYDTLVASTLDLLTGVITPMNGTTEADNTTVVAGLLPSQNPENTPNTTANAARVVWEVVQVWSQEFPEHHSSDGRVSVWGNSYGGHWVPGVMSHIQSQNQKILNGTLNGRPAKRIELDTLGLTNGCIDSKIEGPSYPEYAFNNTYGLQAIPEEVYKESLDNITKPGGCNDLVDQCRALAAESDPGNWGTNETVNAACAAATQYCFTFVQGAYVALSGRSVFDISLTNPASFPPLYAIGFLNQKWVQDDLGVPVNFTVSANHIVPTFFTVTGDPLKVTMDPLNQLAAAGIKVALVYGDRDYRCNWLGGEAVSLALDWVDRDRFAAAGYAPIQTNLSYTGGLVRQHGRVSFSRVFGAGHAVGAYQQETVSRIFDRVMLDKDVATGKQDVERVGSVYGSEGPADVFGVKNVLPESLGPECYVWDAAISCSEEEKLALRNGTAVVKDFILA